MARSRALGHRVSGGSAGRPSRASPRRPRRRPRQRPRHAPSRLAARTRSRRPPGRPRRRRGTGRTRPTRRTAPRVDASPSIACALATACRAASTRDVCPLPIPTSRRSFTSTIAFEVTPRTRRQARSRSSSSSSLGARRVTDVQVAGIVAQRRPGPRRDRRRPPYRIDPVGVGSARRRRRPPDASSTSTRRFGFRARTSSASGVERGRDDDLEEDRHELLRDDRGHRSRQRDHATEGADRVRLERRRPRLGEASGAPRPRTGSCA